MAATPAFSAPLRARELDPTCEVHIVVADAYPNFSICGLTIFSQWRDCGWRTLAHRTIPKIETLGIHLHLNCTATAIDTGAKVVLARFRSGETFSLMYDKVLIATGAVPIRPPIEGHELPGVFVLHTMEESFAFDRYRETVKPRSAVIIGGGYIGLEMADALRHRGIFVSLTEMLPL